MLLCSNELFVANDAAHALALLQARSDWPRRHRAAEQRDEFATAAHSITSSARARNRWRNREGIPGARAAKAATTTIPIVFWVGADPVAFGLVASLNRPGGNLTGVTSLGDELGPKRIELLHELVPTATVIAALINPTSPVADTQSRDMQVPPRAFGLQLHVLHASAERDFDKVFATATELRAHALLISPDALFTSRSEQLAALTVHHAVPTIYQFRGFAAAGGLMSYGDSITDQWRRVGIYVGQILKGKKPADLPVQQATKIELTINLKTAKTLGLTVPASLLGRADEVIE